MCLGRCLCGPAEGGVWMNTWCRVNTTWKALLPRTFPGFVCARLVPWDDVLDSRALATQLRTQRCQPKCRANSEAWCFCEKPACGRPSLLAASAHGHSSGRALALVAEARGTSRRGALGSGAVCKAPGKWGDARSGLQPEGAVCSVCCALRGLQIRYS